MDDVTCVVCGDPVPWDVNENTPTCSASCLRAYLAEEHLTPCPELLHV